VPTNRWRPLPAERLAEQCSALQPLPPNTCVLVLFSSRNPV